MWRIRDILLNTLLEDAYARTHEPQILAHYAEAHQDPPKKSPTPAETSPIATEDSLPKAKNE